jgi:rhodanese-related sulfurtransferase
MIIIIITIIIDLSNNLRTKIYTNSVKGIKMKTILILISILVYANAVNPIALQFSGINVKHTFLDGSIKKYKIERVVNEKCLKVGLDSDTFTDENIKKNIPNECKETFITTKGVIQPFYINEHIKTYGENEVLDFIYNKSSKHPEKYALIDSRKATWFTQETIPSALNVPFEDLKFDEDFEDDYKIAYKNLGVKIIGKDKYDFTNAKTAVFFCNGAWCPISTKSIKYLLSIGYPENKMIWYRGGISSWKLLSLRTTKQ